MCILHHIFGFCTIVYGCFDKGLQGKYLLHKKNIQIEILSLKRRKSGFSDNRIDLLKKVKITQLLII